MYKFCLIFALGFVSNSAYAEWTRIGSTNEDTVYVETSTIKRNDDAVKVWVLHDFTKTKVIEGNNYLSEKRLNEYDCKTEEVRSHAHFFFSENMGSSDMVLSKEQPSYWKLVEPVSTDYSSLELVCSKYYEVKSFGDRLVHRIMHLH